MSTERWGDSWIDSWFGTMLASKHKYQSRRSFLSQMTRVAFGAAGVALASTVRPFAPKLAHGANTAANPWEWCGLHGEVCGTGNCKCPVPGATHCTTASGMFATWVQCCPHPTSGCYHCCTYTDMWVDVPFTQVGCAGTHVNGTFWVGNNVPPGVSPDYLCTIISCPSMPTANVLADCATKCPSPGGFLAGLRKC